MQEQLPSNRDFTSPVPNPECGMVYGGQMQQVSLSPNNARSITIVQKGYGYLVDVGCQTFCIEKKETLIAYLSTYLADPNGTEEKYNKGELFK